MTKQAFDPALHPNKLNLGCGFDKRQGYTNVDIDSYHAPDLVADVTDLGALPDQYYQQILALDLLEHLPRFKCLSTLQEWNRVLCPGGELELKVPDALLLLEQLKGVDNQTADQQQAIIQNLMGTQHQDGDFHLNTFTELTLSTQLAEAGFEIDELRSADGWMIHVRAHKREHCPPPGLLRVADDREFLEQAYQHCLSRPSDPDGRNYYLNRLNHGMAREAVLIALTEQRTSAPSADAQPFAYLCEIPADTEFVLALYRDILKRDADKPGIDWYSSRLAGGDQRMAIIQELVTSDEYRQSQQE